MSARIATVLCLTVSAAASAQTVPVLYSHNGLKATAALTLFDADGPRFSSPRYEAAGLRATSAVEVFPGLRLPNNLNPVTIKDVPLIKRAKSPYRLTDADLNIPDVQDVVFFTETRVIRVRLHLKVAGQPLREAWTKQLRRYFDFLDRDKDGMLNAFEAEFVFSNTSVQQMLQNGNAFNRPNEPGRTLADFDRDGDGKISFDEFVAYYAPSTAALLRVQPSFNRDQFADVMTEELFKQLDRDGDGKLSKAELAEMEKLLPILDQNEDETLAALEIVPNLFNRPRQINPPRVVGQPQVNPTTQPLQIYRPGMLPDTFAEQILIRYDKDKNLRLTKAESGLDDATFAALDRNKDNELSIVELMNWRDLPPDLTFDLTFSTKQSECVTRLHNGPDGKPAPLASAVKIGDGGSTYIRIGQQQLDLGTLASTGVQFAQRNFLFTFEQADRENKGYITEKDIAGPQHQFLRIIFDVVDRNGDGKMTKQEYLDYYELQQSFLGLPLGLTHVTQTPSLFSMIDENRDGRLSIREMRNAWTRLKNLEPGNAEFITKAALQPQATVRYCRASQLFQAVNFNNYNPVVQPTTKGPNWFRKLDRNGDGDLSRNEFPGTDEDFDKLDTNHDGLISVEEAEEADKRLKAEKK